MFDKLEAIERKYQSIEDTLIQPSLDPKEMTRLTKERSELEDIVLKFREYTGLKHQLLSAETLLKEDDEGMRALAKEEILDLSPKLEDIEKQLIVLMLPSDPRDGKNVILEIRAGTGGDEAGIFCGDLLRMYIRYAETQRWRVEMISSHESTRGGFKEIVILIEGQKVFSRLKYEMGVHRVQRVPETEAQGRIHTSACTVAVLPEASDIEVEINPADLKIDTFRSSGAGGQHVNTTDSAIRITHIPSGVVVECQEERSQHKNRDKAMKMLKTRILDKLQMEHDLEMRKNRKSQVGSGDRSERIRTYNFPQGRMTDHRINLTLYKLPDIMNGDLDDILDALGAHSTAEALKEQTTTS